MKQTLVGWWRRNGALWLFRAGTAGWFISLVADALRGSTGWIIFDALMLGVCAHCLGSEVTDRAYAPIRAGIDRLSARLTDYKVNP